MVRDIGRVGRIEGKKNDDDNRSSCSKETEETYIGWLTILADALSGAHLVEKYGKSGQVV